MPRGPRGASRIGSRRPVGQTRLRFALRSHEVARAAHATVSLDLSLREGKTPLERHAALPSGRGEARHRELEEIRNPPAPKKSGGPRDVRRVHLVGRQQYAAEAVLVPALTEPPHRALLLTDEVMHPGVGEVHACTTIPREPPLHLHLLADSAVRPTRSEVGQKAACSQQIHPEGSPVRPEELVLGLLFLAEIPSDYTAR